jgi:hypothetical protein
MKPTTKLLFITAISPFLIYSLINAEALSGTMPPTKAFYNIFTDNKNIQANNYVGNLTIKEGQYIDITANTNNDTITISANIPVGSDTNTAQIVSAGGTTLIKSRDNATQHTLYGLTEGSNISFVVNTNDIEISATGFGSGNATSLNDLSDVSLSGVAYGHILQVATNGYWENELFKANSLTCSGTDKFSAFNNQTGTFTCSTDNGDSSGFSKINNVGSGTIKLVQTNSSSTANIKSLASGQGITLTNGTTSGTIATNFKIDTQSSALDYQIIGFDNSTGDFTRNQFSVNTITCSGTDKISAINNVTGAVTCSSDQTGSGGSASLATINSKRWGSFVPTSATASGAGQLATSFTLDGTETYTYDTSSGAGFAAISSACGTTAGGNCGGVQTATNFDVFRRDQNAYLYIEWRQNEITTERMFLGFRSGTTALPNAADTIVNAINAFGICIRTTDTAYQRCENDASGAGTYTSLGVTQDTNGHYAEIYADATNNQWCVKIDGGSASCATTDIPAATSRMWVNVEAETADTSNTTFIYGTIHVRNDK